MMASRPPGAVARAKVDTTKLRDQSALPTWEQDRQTAKGINNQGFNALTPSIKAEVRNTIQLTYDELNNGVPDAKRRRLANDAPTSPRRDTTSDNAMPGTASGKGYFPLFPAVTPAPAVSGETPKKFGRRLSKPFRRNRAY
jgi:hypothetical protein